MELVAGLASINYFFFSAVSTSRQNQADDHVADLSFGEHGVLITPPFSSLLSSDLSLSTYQVLLSCRARKVHSGVWVRAGLSDGPAPGARLKFSWKLASPCRSPLGSNS